jgi:DNA-3-methyladenine glycosylase
MPRRILSRQFFSRPTLQVAKALLGKHLVRHAGGQIVTGRIVEVEAYVGPEDLACHASKGRTARTDVMFGPAGVAYVYLIYGMYHCLNVVTEREGYPAAVLIRGIEQGEIVGVGSAARRIRSAKLADAGESVSRPGLARLAGPLPTVIAGPGLVCRLLRIDRTLNRHDLTLGQHLWIEDRGDRVSPSAITASPRVGVDYAGEWALKPWRFLLRSSKAR